MIDGNKPLTLLGGIKALAVFVVLIAIGVSVAVHFEKSEPKTTGGDVTATTPVMAAQNASQSSAEPKVPAQCAHSVITGAALSRSKFPRHSVSDFVSDPHGEVAQALSGLIANGNYTLKEVYLQSENGKAHCFAELSIDGLYKGSSYHQTVYAQLFDSD